MIFLEIMPQALSLMTDVFGNYVIQKVVVHVLCFLCPNFMAVLITLIAPHFHFLFLLLSGFSF